MQGVVERMEAMEARLLLRLDRVEATVEKWAQALSGASKKEQNALRRKQYKEAKRRRDQRRDELRVGRAC